ncbi:OmpP1/FadL family transporter [Candidatus Magnetaquicoccus inordinatus]|uniref:OmpP1/FadL family transporter n=1 Tax=Candidatus Magnetaquicoccus inordinatus TaxID=2496818 RepID=UPI00102B6252|nr:outer membrane protein transport protein [Candidatus Magnetaquicoccus inordinatus]
MNNTGKKLLLPLSLLFTMSAEICHATNGYFATGFGTANKAMAGAGVAVPQNAMDTAVNPALMAHVGNRYDAGVALFMPARGFTADQPSGAGGTPTIPVGTFEKDDDFFLVPHFGWNKMLDNERAIGLSIGGNGGMNTQYDIAVFRNFATPGNAATVASSPTGIDMAQIFIGLNYAQKIDAQHTLGIAPVFSVQRVSIEGLQPFKPYSNAPDSVTNNGYDYSYGGGIKLGWYWTPTESLALGASYQSRLYMTAFDKYKGLFADGGDFDIPSIMQAGIAVKPIPEVTVAMDVQHIRFSEIAAVGNNNGVPMPPGSIILGTKNGLGFGWDDMTIYKLGLQWQANPDWTYRAGFSISNEVIPGQQALFNILAPATVTQHLTMGASWNMDANNSLNLAATHAFEKRVNGTNPNTPTQTGSLNMYQNELEISWSYRF